MKRRSCRSGRLSHRELSRQSGEVRARIPVVDSISFSYLDQFVSSKMVR